MKIPEKDRKYLNLVEPYAGKWVAFNSDKTAVVEFGASLESLEKKLAKRKKGDYIIGIISPQDRALIL